MNTPETSFAQRSVRAFTLIEILVASSVMVVLVGIVAYITGSVMNSWNRSSGKLSSNAEARLALDLLTQDLEAAVERSLRSPFALAQGHVQRAGAHPYHFEKVRFFHLAQPG